MTQYIGHTNKIEDATSITVSSEATGFEKENAYDWFLYDWWKTTGASSVTFTVDFGSATSLNSFGIAGHNIGDITGIFYLNASTDNFVASDDNIVGNIFPTGSEVIFRKFTDASYRYWRFAFYSLDAAMTIAQIYLGNVLALPHAPRLGFVSPKNAAEDDISNNMSDGGFNLGRSVY